MYIRTLVVLSGSVYQDTGCLVRSVYQETGCPVWECISGYWLSCQGVYISTLVVLYRSVYHDTDCPARECISGHWLTCHGVYIRTLVVLSGSVYQNTGCPVKKCISGHWLSCQGVYIRTLGVRVGGALCHSVSGGPFRRALPTKSAGTWQLRRQVVVSRLEGVYSFATCCCAFANDSDQCQ